MENKTDKNTEKLQLQVMDGALQSQMSTASGGLGGIDSISDMFPASPTKDPPKVTRDASTNLDEPASFFNSPGGLSTDLKDFDDVSLSGMGLSGILKSGTEFTLGSVLLKQSQETKGMAQSADKENRSVPSCNLDNLTGLDDFNNQQPWIDSITMPFGPQSTETTSKSNSPVLNMNHAVGDTFDLVKHVVPQARTSCLPQQGFVPAPQQQQQQLQTQQRPQQQQMRQRQQRPQQQPQPQPQQLQRMQMRQQQMRQQQMREQQIQQQMQQQQLHLQQQFNLQQQYTKQAQPPLPPSSSPLQRSQPTQQPHSTLDPRSSLSMSIGMMGDNTRFVPTVSQRQSLMASMGQCPEVLAAERRKKAEAEILKRTCTIDGCNKVFATVASKKRHIKSVHNNERPHVCPQCGKRFKQTAHLMKHMRTHTGERPFNCKYCDKRFAQRGTLTYHVQSKHKIST